MGQNVILQGNDLERSRSSIKVNKFLSDHCSGVSIRRKDRLWDRLGTPER